MAVTSQSHRPCPVCLQHQPQLLGQLQYALFEDLQMPGSKTLVGCLNCGMMYDQISFSEADLQRYYFQNEHYATAGEGGAGGFGHDNRARYQRMLDRLKPEPGSLILDFGCGQGGFVRYCQEQGFRAIGLEPSRQSRQVGLDSDCEIYSSLTDLQAAYQGAQIQNLVVSHVLEHLLQPLAELQALLTWAPAARYYLEVPDASAYLAPGALRWPELYFEHLSHFTPEHLAMLAQAAGLQVIDQGQVPFSPQIWAAQCAFLVGIPGQQDIQPAATCPFSWPVGELHLPEQKLPADRPLALWGISQYAMLILGSYPHLTVSRLFDASPAKIGRRLLGIEIEASTGIAELPPDTLLILPYSASLEQMKSLLKQWHFSGEVLEL